MFEFLVSPSHPVYQAKGNIANLPALQKETLVLLSPLSTCGTIFLGPLWYWSLSPMPLYRTLDLPLSLQGRRQGKNKQGKVWLRCDRKEDSSCCVSFWPLRMYQYIDTAGAFINILFHSKPDCNGQGPVYTHVLCIGLIWTQLDSGTTLVTDKGAHILCRFKTEADRSMHLFLTLLNLPLGKMTWDDVSCFINKT